MNSAITTATVTLRRGGTLLYPTDTIWGIGCDATNDEAVERIYLLKQRDHSKSMLVLCTDIAMVEQFVTPVATAVIDLLIESERPTTVILPLRKSLLATNLAAADGSIGVRIPRMAFCQKLLRDFGKPLVSTSANLSGMPSPASYDDISPELKKAVDYCVPRECEVTTENTASRIVRLLPNGNIDILRG